MTSFNAIFNLTAVKESKMTNKKLLLSLIFSFSLYGCSANKTAVLSTSNSLPFVWNYNETTKTYTVKPNMYQNQVYITWTDTGLALVSPKWDTMGGACGVKNGDPTIFVGKFLPKERKGKEEIK